MSSNKKIPRSCVSTMLQTRPPSSFDGELQMNETDTWSARHHYPRVDSSETTRAMTVRVFQQENTTKLRQHHASDTPSVKREPERAHTHVTYQMCVRTQIAWTWLCTRGKKRYKYCSFSHTNRSFRVLGHQCVVTMGNCLIWFSLCMFFFPLI